MLDALRDDGHLTGSQRDVAVTHFDHERSRYHQEEVVRIVVLVPHEEGGPWAGKTQATQAPEWCLSAAKSRPFASGSAGRRTRVIGYAGGILAAGGVRMRARLIQTPALK